MRSFIFLATALVLLSASQASVVRRQITCNNGNCERNCQVNCYNNACQERCNPVQVCNDCPNNNCNECERTPPGGGSTDSKIDVNKKTSSDNSHQNTLHLNIKNEINNVNNISNPIEISNVNNFTYSGVSQSGSRSSGSGGGYTGGPERQCCGNSCYRQPIILPRYVPPPPPCYFSSQPYCTNQPQHNYVASQCAPCFYCGGQYNPRYCSQQTSCPSSCIQRECYGRPCYPQLRPCNDGKEEEDIDTEKVKKEE